MDKVSAIITTSNRNDDLKKAIKSVENQTYKNIELIVVDDGSTDGTKEYCQNLKDVKYIYISEAEHKNGNYARNLGIKNSNGKYVAFLDDDDEWMPTKIEKQVMKMSENDYGMVYTGRTVEVNDGEYYYHNPARKIDNLDCSKLSLYSVLATTSSMMMKRDVLDRVGLFDENLNFWQETELVIRISQVSKIGYVDEELILYRQRLKSKKQLTNNVDGFKKAVEYINEKHKDKIEKLSDEEKKKRKKGYYQDLANRYATIGNNFKCRYYLFKMFLLFPSIKSFTKFVLNFTIIKKLRIILFIKRKK